ESGQRQRDQRRARDDRRVEDDPASRGGRGAPWPAARGRRSGRDAPRPRGGCSGCEVLMAATDSTVDAKAQSTPTSATKLVVTQVRSSIGCKANQRATLK